MFADKVWIPLVSNRMECVLADSDECQTEVCDDATSTCFNTAGSYRCQCHSGYEQDPLDTNRCTGCIYTVTGKGRPYSIA